MTERIVKLEEKEVSASKEVQLYHKAVIDLITYYHSCITLMNHQLAYLDSIITQLENNWIVLNNSVLFFNKHQQKKDKIHI